MGQRVEQLLSCVGMAFGLMAATASCDYAPTEEEIGAAADVADLSTATRQDCVLLLCTPSASGPHCEETGLQIPLMQQGQFPAIFGIHPTITNASSDQQRKEEVSGFSLFASIGERTDVVSTVTLFPPEALCDSDGVSRIVLSTASCESTITVDCSEVRR